MLLAGRRTNAKPYGIKRAVGQEQGDGFLLFLFPKSSILSSSRSRVCLPCLLHLRQGKCAVSKLSPRGETNSPVSAALLGWGSANDAFHWSGDFLLGSIHEGVC